LPLLLPKAQNLFLALFIPLPKIPIIDYPEAA
jgi:hypothetical protein